MEARTGLLLVGLFFSAVLLLTIPRDVAVRLGPCLVALLAANASLVAAQESAGAERLVWSVLAATCGFGTLARIILLLGEVSGTFPTVEGPVTYGISTMFSNAVVAGFGVAAFLRPHQHSGRPMRPPIIVDSFLLVLLAVSLQFYFGAAARASASEWRDMPAAILAVAMDLAAAGVLSATRRRPGSLRWKTAYVRLALAAICHGEARPPRHICSVAPVTRCGGPIWTYCWRCWLLRSWRWRQPAR